MNMERVFHFRIGTSSTRWGESVGRLENQEGRLSLPRRCLSEWYVEEEENETKRMRPEAI